MKNTIKKLFVVCFFLLLTSFIFLKAEGVASNYGDLNMYVMKQGKVVIVNSSNNDIRIGFVEEGYTMYRHDSSGLFTRNDQDVDVVLNNEIWIMKREEEGNI